MYNYKHAFIWNIFCFLIHRFAHCISWTFNSSTFPVMGNSGSTGSITPTPRKLSWGRQKEDTVKLEDFLTQYEEDLWRVKGKQNLSVKRVHLTRSIRYVELAAQESDSFYPNRGEVLNPAFVGDHCSWITEFTVDSWIQTTTQASKKILSVVMVEGATASSPFDATATWEIFHGGPLQTNLTLTTRPWVLTYEQEVRPECKLKNEFDPFFVKWKQKWKCFLLFCIGCDLVKQI